MPVNILIITHKELANAFVSVAKETFENEPPAPISTVEVSPDTDPEKLVKELNHLLKSLDKGDGTLILTDLFGATPCNIAKSIQRHHNVKIVSGLNLPMLFSVINNTDLSLAELAEKAFEKGKKGVSLCDNDDA